MIRFLALSLSFILLSACATAVDSATQVVSIQTPGAEGGICYLERPGYRQRVWVPQRVHITKSEDPLVLTCIAPGDRVVRKQVKPKINKATYLNVFTGIVTAAVDYESGAMFEFPDVITVDFTQLEVRSMPLPDYHDLLVRYPELAGLEEFRPGRSILLRDRTAVEPDLTPRRDRGELYSDSGLTEIRTNEDAYFPLPEVVGQGAEPVSETGGPVGPGGEPVIGGGAADDIGTALPPDVEPLTP